MTFIKSSILYSIGFLIIGLVASTNFVFASGEKSSSRTYERLLKTWNQPYPPFKIFERVYYVGTSLIAVFLIDTGDGLILIDSGMSEHADVVQKNIGKLGFDVKKIKVLLSTHAHFDHVGGHRKMKELTQAIVWASDADAVLLSSGGRQSFFPFYFFPSVKVDKKVTDGQIHEIGDIKFESVLTPGHTEGATSWLFIVPFKGKKTKIMVASSLSVNDGVKLHNNKEWPAVYQSYKNTFARLKKIDAEIFLTAHSDLFEMENKRKVMAQGGDNPFLDSSALKTYIGKFEDRFLKLTQ